jgi:hypothetical protein
MPTPIILATAVDMNAPAIRTATAGLSARVETTVAIVLALSCHPFEKSNRRASTTTSKSIPLSSGMCSISGKDRGGSSDGSSVVFQRDAFQNVRHVLAAISALFKMFVNLFPLGHRRTQRALRTRPCGPSFLLLAEIRKAIPAEACRQKPNGCRARERLRFRGPGPRRNWLRLGVGFRPHERSVRACGSR